MRITEYESEKIDKKSKNFLKTIIGKDNFDKLTKNGKIEIEHGNDDNKVIYELYSDGRLINKTKNESYCIVADRSDYPIADLIAIKYAWLVYDNNRAEKVANKTYLRSVHSTNAGYAEYVDYITSIGWRREQITINETNTNFVSTYNVQKDSTGKIIDIRCPAGTKMSLMGIQQIPAGGNISVAYPLSLHITDDNGDEIPPFTKIRISKTRPTDMVIQLARIFYVDINEYIPDTDTDLTNNNNNNSNNNSKYGRKKTYEELYRFHHGIEINGEEYLEIFIVNSDRHISAENIKLKIDFDFWNRT